MRRRWVTIVLMGTLLLFAAACGQPTPEVAGSPGDGEADDDRRDAADAPSEPDAPVSSDPPAPSDGDGDAGGAAIDEDRARQRAESLLGLTEQEASARGEDAGFAVRVGRRGDERLMLTEDLRPGRATLGLGRDDGDWVVTTATVEHRGGEVVAER